ncbi:M48 family metallopeptidase [Salaquimonas pukyongi]|uniref:M48 family metallopeptidase n=1 Tax=Salaquimonas pukyongi TaxID=2712698 RepID=UPI00096B9230|nr:SprT family zinc-dependent metalloprotease [Salaquimonas pukyongi]
MANRLLSRFSRSGEPRNRDRHVEIDGWMLPVRVIEHPTSRRITLRLMPGGDGLKVTMPPHVSDDELEEFLERNRQWVSVRRARLPKTVSLGVGAIIPFRGIDHRIVHLDRLRGIVEAKEVAGEPSLLVPGEPSRIGRRVVDFMKKQARSALDEAVARHASALGVRPRQIRITDTTSRWGSCSTTRTLSFSWRIIMAPPQVLDYLAAHEVAHLREMNHSDRFWSHVRSLCPDMESHKAWLRRNGSGLHAISVNA